MFQNLFSVIEKKNKEVSKMDWKNLVIDMKIQFIPIFRGYFFVFNYINRVMETKFKCPRCDNEEEEYLGKDINGKTYCRKCLPFCGNKVDEGTFSFSPISSPKLRLKYPLTDAQRIIAERVRENFKRKIPVLINAVTGAGKTELVYFAMEQALIEGKRVGFATPRKDVVLELVPRIKEAFPSAEVVAVCEDHTENLLGHIIVLTSHQLYRYPKFFDLLIFDEIDAFPYKGNSLLYRFFKDSLRGTYVMLSATPTEVDISKIKKEGGEVLNLEERYHGKKLPVPVFKKSYFFQFLLLFKDLKRMLKEGKQVFVFSPTIEEGEKLFDRLSVFFPEGGVVSSKDKRRERKIDEFKKGKLRFLVTTSILERGVTVKDLQVLVYKADTKDIYNSATLIQIAGRAGRKMGYEDGEVIFYGQVLTLEIEEAIKGIQRANERKALSSLL